MSTGTAHRRPEFDVARTLAHARTGRAAVQQVISVGLADLCTPD